MLRFKEKYLIYVDKELGDKLFCQIIRDLSNYCIHIKVAYLCDVDFDDFGNLSKIEQIDFQHVCSLTSWQQYVNRMFPGSRFCKISETYIY